MRCLPHIARASLAALAFLAPAATQTIHTVDASGGAGSQFTDIQSAIFNASPGDTILVRPGSYEGFSVGKPLHILGSPAAIIDTPRTGGEIISLSNLPAGTDTTISGLQVATFSFTFGSIDIRNCAGRVLLENVSESGPFFVIYGVEVVDSAQVTLTACNFASSVRAVRSTVAMADCDVQGTDGGAGTPALEVSDARIILSRCSMTAGASAVHSVAQPAVRATDSSLAITGDRSGFLQAGSGSNPSPASAIAGSGTTTVDIDDDVVLLPTFGAPAVAPPLVANVTNIPSLRAQGAPIGGEVIVDLFSEPGHSYYLFVGTPGTPLAITGQINELWLQLAGAAFVEFGALGGSGRVTRGYLVPNLIEFVGVPVLWQGVAGVGDTARLSNPDGYVHGM